MMMIVVVLVAVAAHFAGDTSDLTETGWELNLNYVSFCCALKLKLVVLCV